MINDSNRKIITRWRLSSHPLFIETGRYKVPIIPKEDRVCIICSVIEDENHALFNCVAHSFLRVKHKEIYDKYPNTAAMLNPKTEEDIKKVAEYIKAIEKNMDTLKMVR